jgi:hypothetical protein
MNERHFFHNVEFDTTVIPRFEPHPRVEFKLPDLDKIQGNFFYDVSVIS